MTSCLSMTDSGWCSYFSVWGTLLYWHMLNWIYWPFFFFFLHIIFVIICLKLGNKKILILSMRLGFKTANFVREKTKRIIITSIDIKHSIISDIAPTSAICHFLIIIDKRVSKWLSTDYFYRRFIANRNNTKLKSSAN